MQNIYTHVVKTNRNFNYMTKNKLEVSNELLIERRPTLACTDRRSTQKHKASGVICSIGGGIGMSHFTTTNNNDRLTAFDPGQPG